MTQTIRTHVPVASIGPDCDVHVRLGRTFGTIRPDDRYSVCWIGVYSHQRQTWIFPCTQQSVTAALAAAKVVLR